MHEKFMKFNHQRKNFANIILDFFDSNFRFFEKLSLPYLAIYGLAYGVKSN